MRHGFPHHGDGQNRSGLIPGSYASAEAGLSPMDWL